MTSLTYWNALEEHHRRSFNWQKWTWNIYFSEDKNVMTIYKQLADGLIW